MELAITKREVCALREDCEKPGDEQPTKTLEKKIFTGGFESYNDPDYPGVK